MNINLEELSNEEIISMMAKLASIKTKRDITEHSLIRKKLTDTFN